MLRVLVTLTTIGTVSLIVRHYRILIQYLKVRDLIRPSGKYADALFTLFRDIEVNRTAAVHDP